MCLKDLYENLYFFKLPFLMVDKSFYISGLFQFHLTLLGIFQVNIGDKTPHKSTLIRIRNNNKR